jgi:AcrR family transcriptional regulator
MKPRPAPFPAGDLPPRQRILAAAGELFYRDGIQATGVDAVVARAGVAKVTLYKHFGAKEGLVAAYLQDRHERWRAWLPEAVDARATDPRRRLLAVFDALDEWLEGEGFRGCAFINTAMEIADPAHAARVVVETDKRWLRDYLHELAAAAELDEPARLADQLLILVDGATVAAVIGVATDAVGRAKAAADTLIGPPP